jgi:hypothetical protein
MLSLELRTADGAVVADDVYTIEPWAPPAVETSSLRRAFVRRLDADYVRDDDEHMFVYSEVDNGSYVPLAGAQVIG